MVEVWVRDVSPATKEVLDKRMMPEAPIVGDWIYQQDICHKVIQRRWFGRGKDCKVEIYIKLGKKHRFNIQ